MNVKCSEISCEHNVGFSENECMYRVDERMVEHAKSGKPMCEILRDKVLRISAGNSLMTLDEAIIHAQEVADTQKDLCVKCRQEHQQLATWLRDYRKLLLKEIKQSEWV